MKIVNFQRNSRVLVDVAEARLDRGDYFGAFSAYKSALKEDGKDFSAHCGIAELYTEADLYESALNHWFLALKLAQTNTEHARVYNGLAANFYFSNQDSLVPYYFNYQLSCDVDGEYLYDDVLKDAAVVEELSPQPFTVVYDKKLDTAGRRNIDLAQSLSLRAFFAEAIDLLKGIEEQSPHYVEALEKLSFLQLISNDFEGAGETAKKLLAKNSDNFHALFALCDIAFMAGDSVSCNILYEKLKQSGSPSRDEAVKLLMLSLDMGEAATANEYLTKLLTETPYDPNLIYVRGVFRYNCGDKVGAESDLKHAALILDSTFIRKQIKEINGKNPPRSLAYEFNVKEISEATPLLAISKQISADESYFSYTKRTFRDASKRLEHAVRFRVVGAIGDCVRMSYEANKLKTLRLIDSFLMDVNVVDKVKVAMIAQLTLMGEKRVINGVFTNIYKKTETLPCVFSSYSGELFGRVYANIAGYFCIFMRKHLPEVIVALKDYQKNFEANNAPLNVSVQALSSAAVIKLNYSEISNKDYACRLFDADENAVEEMLAYITEK